MVLSLNCLILGQTSDDIFTKYIGEESKIDGVQVTFDQLTVAGFKKLLFHEEQLKGITNMDLLKVELNLDSLENKTYTKDDISTIGTKMLPGCILKGYFEDNDKQPEKKPKQDYLHIFIVPTIVAGKCLPTLYLSNKRFAVTKYRVWSDVIIFFLFTRITFVISFLLLYNQHKKL